MARPSFFPVLGLVLWTSAALPADDQNTMLQSKVQVLGLASDGPKQVPARLNFAAQDHAGRVRSSLMVLFRLYATEERAEALAGRWAAVLQRGKEALGLPCEAEELAWQLLDDAARAADGSGLRASAAWAPRLASLVEALAARLEQPGELARQTEIGLAWATREINNTLEALVPGQPMAAAALVPLLMARDYTAKVGVSEVLTHTIGTINAALQRGDFDRPTTCIKAVSTVLNVAARAELPMLGRAAEVCEYLAAAMVDGGDEPAAWPDAVMQVAHYMGKGNRPPIPSGLLKLLGQLRAAGTTEETVGVLIQASAGLLEEHGEQLGLGQGLLAGAGRFAKLARSGTASLSSPDGISQTLKRALGGVPMGPDVPQLMEALAEPGAVLKNGLPAVLAAVPDWGVEFAAKLVPRLWGHWQKVMGPGQNTPMNFGELFSGLVPHIPDNPALQTLLETAVSSLKGMMAGDGQAASRLLRAMARELRKEGSSTHA